MKILAIETSAKSISAAVTEDGHLLAYTYQHTGLTHSRTLMPMVESMLNNAELKLADIDGFAVSHGPGSFTGLRIGISAVKGLAWTCGKPCCGVSTLEAMAQPLSHMKGTIICAMDARRQQVYNAIFTAGGGQLQRIAPDRAIALEELAEEVRALENPKIVVGDGAKLCFDYLSSHGIPCRLAPEHLQMQSAVGVAAAAEQGPWVDAQELTPQYLRLSQAERERLAREEQNKTNQT